MAVAIVAWTRRYPAVTGAIVGARSAAQVDGIMSGAFDLDPAEIAEIEAGPDWEEGAEHWLYPQLYECGCRLAALVDRYRQGDVLALVQQVLNQCLRELRLGQGSDWSFLINNGTAADYASRRVRDHVARFRALADAIEHDRINLEYLLALEQMDNPFPQADYRIF